VPLGCGYARSAPDRPVVPDSTKSWFLALDALLSRFPQFSDSPRLISLQGQELGVSRKDLGGCFFKLSRLFDPQADRINPIRGNPLDMLLTVQHEGERPDGVTLAVGAMAGGLAAS
jgi:hypothetical protein